MISVMDVLTIFITGFIAGGVCNYIHCLESLTIKSQG